MKPYYNKMRCPSYDDPTTVTDETAEEYLCEYCGMRGKWCDGRGNITIEKPKPSGDRNASITVAVLRGWQLRKVGNVFGISPERVRQIVRKIVPKYDKKLSGYLYGVKEYRKHKNRLISTILGDV